MRNVTVRKVEGGYIAQIARPLGDSSSTEVVCTTFDDLITLIYRHIHPDSPVGLRLTAEGGAGRKRKPEAAAPDERVGPSVSFCWALSDSEEYWLVEMHDGESFAAHHPTHGARPCTRDTFRAWGPTLRVVGQPSVARRVPPTLSTADLVSALKAQRGRMADLDAISRAFKEHGCGFVTEVETIISWLKEWGDASHEAGYAQCEEETATFLESYTRTCKDAAAVIRNSDHRPERLGPTPEKEEGHGGPNPES